MPLPRWLGVGPRGCEWRVRAGIFGWLYSDSLSRCDNHRRHEGCRVGTELDMQRGVAEVGDGNVHRARAARLCMYVEALGRPLPRSGRAGRQRACVSTHSREAVLSKKTVKYPSNALHTRCITSWCIEGVWGAGVGSDGMQGAARPKRGCAKQAHDLARHVPATADPVPAPYPPSQLTNGHDSPSQPPPRSHPPPTNDERMYATVHGPPAPGILPATRHQLTLDAPAQHMPSDAAAPTPPDSSPDTATSVSIGRTHHSARSGHP